ncbi:hypothetical protein MUY27_16590 [Mucilaginibacter sp. RS28]|uniref:Uncharacterized protein n=1 Tax=Mucilaginibacter straminoryzae TaxID=2932774 RepID=A0A9X2BEF0_9SPHI|nr:hypothetical protein [Mucilaginibacter straminoryzae]MCJ8211338.1 hypothetical protein [Mucilaginibacter straminoryzae]
MGQNISFYFIENPDFIFFTVNEVMSGKLHNLAMVNKMKSLEQSHFADQLKELYATGKIGFHPVNILWNITGMIFFPFLTRLRMLDSGYFNSEEFTNLMLERKKLIPIWVRQSIS